ncbi:glycoside hydrolase family 3 C-terminal domain-containing protein [Acidipila rosea]|uniref:Beta-glucosidase n=1 Tax=Acidipila rosea TaxID=768535 RepID=A0A4R1KXM3_9BACT|nr:glycoside hydrolase family 3 C-terminal domain-containing protein [Acidipila rosea]TCK70162.1 beta-glucosidase [Acidipila rosea]
MKSKIIAICWTGVLTAIPLCAQSQYPFQNPSLPAEQRITDLISRMTIQEKIDCLGTDPSVPRLGVKGTRHVEGLHGLALGGPGHWEGRKGETVIPTTQFPQSRGLGQTWDPALLEQAAAVEGYETRYAYQSPKYHRGGLVVRAPNADLSRDPRWGRSEESYGEDPYLVGTLAVGFVRGLQGGSLHYWQTASLMKHFLANSNEDGRDGSSSNFDTRLFHEYYSVPFRMGIEEGLSNAFMTAYNAWNHIPMAAQPVLKDVVMKDWGFNGIICTDAGALTNMVTAHHYYPSLDKAAAGALHAGVNQFLDKYKQPVQQAYDEKLITDAEINENLRGVFRVMIKLGMLDPASMNPYASIGSDASKGDPWDWADHKALARKVTDESIVLLKNDGSMLPLDATRLRSIAVIGPYADKVLLDWYSGTPPYSISPLEGIRKRAGAGVDVQFATGYDLDAATALAKKSDLAIVVIGNHPTCNAGWAKCPLPSDGKEAIDRKSLTLEQEEIAKRVYAVNPHTIVVLNASFPFTVNWTAQNIPAIVEMTHNSEEEGDGLADVLFGDYNPAGRLTQTWPASMDQLPPMMDYNIRHGRTYMYFKGKPLYPFGYGLSYTSFAYSKLKVSTSKLKAGESVVVSVEVKNTGKRPGDEVVQLYVTHLGSQVERPLEELKGFARVSIPAGKKRMVKMPLKASNLAYWDDATQKWVVEADQVAIKVGSASDNIKLQKTIEVTK